ncbi:MAG: LPP20 family lipoprotein [Spirochaetaceae bacterium]|nr:LPP20 family lipoprotein [Spirochaetaceae bacterium]
MKLFIRSFFIIILITSLFMLSCTSLSVDKDNNSLINRNENIDLKDPVIVNGVIDFTDPLYSFMWNTAPSSGKMVFSSFIPRRANREEEIDLAVAEAARQAAMLYKSKVDAKFAVQSNNRDLGFLEAIDIQYDKDMAEALKPKIKITKNLRDNEGTYVLSELEGINFKGNFLDLSKPGQVPDWLTNIPVIPGYLVSVGTVQRSRYKIDSIRRADEQALANLAKQVSVVVKAKRADRDSEVSGSAFSETNYEVTSTFIRGFYVLGRWSTDNGNTYYTLAVCPESQ